MTRTSLILRLKIRTDPSSFFGHSILASIRAKDDPDQILSAIAEQSKTNFPGVEEAIGRILLQDILKYVTSKN